MKLLEKQSRQRSAWNRMGWNRALAGLGAAAVTVVMTAGTASAAPGSTGSLGSLGSSGGGSIGSGSSIPEMFQNDPGPVPETRDDIEIPEITRVVIFNPRVEQLTIASPALRREVTVDVLRPADTSEPRPTLYMLDGVSASNNRSGWMNDWLDEGQGGTAPGFFADKNTNVVLLNGARGSMYVDWENEDPKLGLNKWETFITEELPPLINEELGTNGVNAIAGNSMGAQAAMMLAHRNPELYGGVAAFSGCYSTSDSIGRLTAQVTVTSQGGDPANMWPEDSPQWEAHDTVRHAENLRGMDLYVSVQNGLPGEYDEGSTDLNRLVVGGALEAGSNVCTRNLETRLNALGIPATFSYEGHGVHAWEYWAIQLPKAWPTLEKALELD